MSTFNSETLDLIQRLKKANKWTRIKWKQVAQKYLDLQQSDNNIPELRKRLSTWYHKRPKPKTKEELRGWVEEYNRGVVLHGEPNMWNITLVTDMSELFKNMQMFNAPIGQWDTSQVTNMRCMFQRATAFNQPLTLDTSQVTDMRGMFVGATSFNQPLVWDTSGVTDMRSMFQGAKAFNQPLTLDTSQVTTMGGMFQRAYKFNQPLTLDTSQVTDMQYMFFNASTYNQPLTLDTSQVTDMQAMFYGARAFNQPLTLDTSQVTDMKAMCYDATSFDQPLTLATSQVTDMSYMFFNASAFNQPLTLADTSQVTNMRNMFSDATAFNQPLTLDTRKVTDMSDMFFNASTFNQPLTLGDTSQVTSMRNMFRGATAFNQPLTLDTSQVTDMCSMFYKSHPPLWWACAEGHDIAQLLAVSGTDVNQAAPDGRTPLWWACKRGRARIVAQLLAMNDINANRTTNNGLTPFSTACLEGHVGIVRQLLDYSASQMGTEEEYRQKLEEDTKKVEEDQLNKLTLSQFVGSIFPETFFPGLQLQAEDGFTVEKMNCPVRLLPCKHPCEASPLQTWFKTAKSPDNPNYKHNECIKCRVVPQYIEVMNKGQVERWNRMKREEEAAETTLEQIRPELEKHPRLQKLNNQSHSYKEQLKAKNREMNELDIKILELHKKKDILSNDLSVTKKGLKKTNSDIDNEGALFRTFVNAKQAEKDNSFKKRFESNVALTF